MGSMPDLRTSTKPVPCASVAQVLARPDARVIDLRSPGEFADDHLPGAVNVPLFDDAERALVGTLYARSSAQAAFDAATEIVEARVRALVDAVGAEVDWTPPPGELLPQVRARTAEGIAAMERELVVVGRDELPARPVVLHCWRGGLRSRSVVSLLRELGLERAVGLEGGEHAAPHGLKIVDGVTARGAQGEMGGDNEAAGLMQPTGRIVDKERFVGVVYSHGVSSNLQRAR